MSQDALVAKLADEWALRRLAESYAQAMDGDDEALLASLFTSDGVIEGAGKKFSGIDEICSLQRGLRANYTKTFHLVGNQIANVSGDSADAVTYSVAKHLTDAAAGAATCFEMTIRYHDQFHRDESGWRFTRRSVVIEWTQTYSVDL